jgi:hypothetical protein
VLKLASWYLLESSCNYAAWHLSGIGIRLAQDVGAHRKKVYSNPITPDDELWKRAFWSVHYLLFTTLSYCLRGVWLASIVSLARQWDGFRLYMTQSTFYSNWSGARPHELHSIDVDLPLEVDDEYWTTPDPSQAFQQPADKPAQVTAFINLLKLGSIVAYVLQTIVCACFIYSSNPFANPEKYAVNKSHLKGSTGAMWEHQTLAEIDTMLSGWIDNLPSHREYLCDIILMTNILLQCNGQPQSTSIRYSSPKLLLFTLSFIILKS